VRFLRRQRLGARSRYHSTTLPVGEIAARVLSRLALWRGVRALHAPREKRWQQSLVQAAVELIATA
jgi:hypothetical protein